MGCSLHAYGQFDSRSLRAAFGPPTKQFKTPPKEVFIVLPGLALTANYSPNHKLCTLEIARGVASQQQVDAVLEKAVPSQARGKKWHEMEQMLGIAGFENRYYEKLIISEDIFTPGVINKSPGATVFFKEQACGWKPGNDVFDTSPGAPPQSDRQ